MTRLALKEKCFRDFEHIRKSVRWVGRTGRE